MTADSQCLTVLDVVEREQVGVRLNAQIIEAIDRLAATEQRNRSDMIRVLLVEALNARSGSDVDLVAEVQRVVEEAMQRAMRSSGVERPDLTPRPPLDLDRIRDALDYLPKGPEYTVLNHFPEDRR